MTGFPETRSTVLSLAFCRSHMLSAGISMLQACLLNASKGSLLPASGIMLWLWQAALLRAAMARCLTETGMTGFPETPLSHACSLQCIGITAGMRLPWHCFMCMSRLFHCVLHVLRFSLYVLRYMCCEGVRCAVCGVRCFMCCFDGVRCFGDFGGQKFNTTQQSTLKPYQFWYRLHDA